MSGVSPSPRATVLLDAMVRDEALMGVLGDYCMSSLDYRVMGLPDAKYKPWSSASRELGGDTELVRGAIAVGRYEIYTVFDSSRAPEFLYRMLPDLVEASIEDVPKFLALGYPSSGLQQRLSKVLASWRLERGV